MDATKTVSELPEQLRCETCEGRGLLCPLTDSLTCTHSRNCRPENCAACDGLGFIECATCGDGTPADITGDDPQCVACFRAGITADDLARGWKPDLMTAAGAAAWGEVVAATEFGDLPTEPEGCIPFAALVWETPTYQPPAVGRFDNNDCTVELPCVEG